MSEIRGIVAATVLINDDFTIEIRSIKSPVEKNALDPGRDKKRIVNSGVWRDERDRIAGNNAAMGKYHPASVRFF
jgi:hypothetical protein